VKTKIVEFILVMSCFLLMFLVNFIQSIEQRDTIASASALRLKEKLDLEDAQAAAIKTAILSFYKALARINRDSYADENTYQEAVQQIRLQHHEEILQSLTHQQQQQWQDVLKKECLDEE
jgi:hypothetical protein